MVLGRATLLSINIFSAIAYSPGDRVIVADLSVAGSTVTEGYVSNVLDQFQDVESGVR